MSISLPSIKCSGLLPASDYCRALFRCLNCAQQVDYQELESSRKLEGAAEHLIDGSKNAFVGWAFNFIQSPHLTERRSKFNALHT